MRKGFCIYSVFFVVLMLLSFSCFSAFAAENHYYIKELNMGLDLPDNMYAITRESPETDKYFSLFGLDYSTTMNNFNSNNIYLQGMYEDSSRVFTVTMFSDENSKSVGNYSDLNDEQLLNVQNSFLAEAEYTSCAVKRYNNYVFMQLQLKTKSNDQTVYATQCNTVIDGQNITLTLQPAKDSELTNEDYQNMDIILQSVEFDGHKMFEVKNLITNPIFWIIVFVIIILIVLIVFMIKKKHKKKKKNIKNNEKKIKNQEILSELAKEYSSHPIISQNNFSEDISPTEKALKNSAYDEETADDIITQFRNSKDFEEINKKREALSKEEAKTEEQKINSDNISIVSENNIVSTSSEKETQNKNSNTAFTSEENPILKVVTPDKETKEDEQKDSVTDKYEEESFKKTKVVSHSHFEGEVTQEYSKDEEEEYEDEYEEEYEEEYVDFEDSPVIGSERSFEQSEDYFDEELELDNDIYSRKTVDDEDNYERNHVSSVNKEIVKKKAKTVGAVILNGILIFLNGVKSFFIHLGYFFTNLYRMIKRNITMRKRRKAEMIKRRQYEEAKRRREENLRRKQQNISKDANGLLKVHSRNEYPVQNNKDK